MRYELPDIPFITPQSMRLRYGAKFDPNVFARWQRDGLVEKVRNGLYRRTNWKMRAEVDRMTVAQRLYGPSYVSILTALDYYDFIPETVVEFQSITTRIPRTFEVDQEFYSYRKVQPKLFFGYEDVAWRDSYYRIATPEKALLDLAYLQPLFSDPDWLEEMRFDEEGMEELNWELLNNYLERCGMPILFQRFELLQKVYAL